jgi:diadenosine tetraphosphate (Ap4A) HIT family hydrolase
MSLWKGVRYDSTGNIMSCLFCQICERTQPATIINSNDKFVAFLTIAPVTNLHVLISPRRHISNLHSLQGEKDATFVEEMMKVWNLLQHCRVDQQLFVLVWTRNFKR